MPFSNVAITLRVMSPVEYTSRTNHGQISNSFPRWNKLWLATVVAECSSRRSETATLCRILTIRQKFSRFGGDGARPRYHFHRTGVLRGQFEFWR